MDYKIELINSVDEIEKILIDYDNIFIPSLSSARSDLHLYAEKLAQDATIYVAKDKDNLGFIAFYVNDSTTDISFLSLIAVNPKINKKGTGNALLQKYIEVSREKGKSKLRLQVDKKNTRAIKFYEKNDFHLDEEMENTIYMIKDL